MYHAMIHFSMGRPMSETTPVLCLGRAAALSALLLPPPALAQSDISVDITYASYELDSDTLPDIQAEMNLEGPYGFPAYTTWQVNWTAACEISVTAQITLPALGPDADLSEEDETTFLTMLENLEEHEENHVDFGLGFAREVQEMGCRGDTAAVLQEWLAEERQYDADTEHGRTEGAWLIDE
jgi:predicted secreted Zn-dependent protease